MQERRERERQETREQERRDRELDEQERERREREEREQQEQLERKERDRLEKIEMRNQEIRERDIRENQERERQAREYQFDTPASVVEPRRPEEMGINERSIPPLLPTEPVSIWDTDNRSAKELALNRKAYDDEREERDKRIERDRLEQIELRDRRENQERERTNLEYKFDTPAPFANYPTGKDYVVTDISTRPEDVFLKRDKDADFSGVKRFVNDPGIRNRRRLADVADSAVINLNPSSPSNVSPKNPRVRFNDTAGTDATLRVLNQRMRSTNSTQYTQGPFGSSSSSMYSTMPTSSGMAGNSYAQQMTSRGSRRGSRRSRRLSRRSRRLSRRSRRLSRRSRRRGSRRR
jgi:hypothetical protein